MYMFLVSFSGVNQYNNLTNSDSGAQIEKFGGC